MPTLRDFSEDKLEKYLQEMRLPIGARCKISKALEESATAARKAAELKAAEHELHVAAVRLENDAARIEKQRKQIEQLKGVIAERKKPAQIVCPISHDVMVDPVVAADGHTYECAQIEAWLSKSKTSPMTGADLKHTTLTENIVVRGMVQDFLDACRAAGADPNDAAWDDAGGGLGN